MKLGFTIGEIAAELQLNPKTIRYYEGIGLLPKPRRTESGYRLYSKADIERLRLVKRAKLLGLSLAETREIVDYAIDQHCAVLEKRLLALLETKLGEIDQKIEELVSFRGDLRRYQAELSRRLKADAGEVSKAPRPDPCQCIGETTGGGEAIRTHVDILWPEESLSSRKGGETMAQKGKKGPKATTAQKECGCGCLPVKK
ncbi:MAG: MerR family transcriptional regulator [Chloroflexi bacterium]|nr:MerR family transcriptional regulator [Chloroflexota bacterium]